MHYATRQYITKKIGAVHKHLNENRRDSLFVFVHERIQNNQYVIYAITKCVVLYVFSSQEK